MGYYLDSDTGEQHIWGVESWPRLLSLAQMCGWTPKGTEAPEPEEVAALPSWAHSGGQHSAWDGGYLHFSGQRVMPEDGSALADALTRALPDIPDQAIVPETADWDEGATLVRFDPEAERLEKRSDELNNLEWFAGPTRKQEIREFIAFCRCGAFVIW